MSPAFPTRRRADEFHALVTDPAADRPAGLVELLDVVAELRGLPLVSPRPEFSASLRERLMVEADTALATLPTAGSPLALSPRRRARDRRIATLIGGAALLGATTSMAVAAQSALPGDSLYPVKRALEDVEAGLAGDDSALGQALLDNASGRLVEVNALALRGTDGIAAVPDTLVEFTEQSLEGSEILLRTYDETGDESIIEELRDFTHDSMETLLALEAQVPARARDELVEAARALTRIDDRARSVCPSCGGAGITEIPPFLLSVAALPTADVTQAAVPSATRPMRPAPAGPAPRGRDTDGHGEHEGVSLPVVELDDRESSAEHTPEDEAPEDAPEKGPRDPVRELTTTLTKPENASTQKPLTDLLDRVGGELDETVEGPVDTLLD